jgi:hypothetical protein
MGYRQLAQYEAKLSRGLETPFNFAGAPTSGAGGTYANLAVVGSKLLDTVNGKDYVATAVGGGSVTWTVVGTQL